MPLNSDDFLGHVPFVHRDHQRAAFFQHHAGDLEILMLQPARGVQQQHDHLGEIDGVARIGHRHLFQLLGNLRLLAHPRRVDQAHGTQIAVFGIGPRPVDGDRIAGDARFRPGQQAVLAQHGVDQRGLARIGTPHDGQLQRRAVERFLVFLLNRLGLELVLVALDMGSSASNRSAMPVPCSALKAMGSPKPSAKGIEKARIACLALGLVGQKDHRHVLRAQPAGDFLVQRGDARARSNTNSATSASVTLASVCIRIRPGRWWGPDPPSPPYRRW
jgi:hypothetical protein